MLRLALAPSAVDHAVVLLPTDSCAHHGQHPHGCRCAVALPISPADRVMERRRLQNVDWSHCGVWLRRLVSHWVHVRTLSPVECRRPNPKPDQRSSSAFPRLAIAHLGRVVIRVRIPGGWSR